eukprot:Clim_evm2s155 gene=Clim_evmTU2s155
MSNESGKPGALRDSSPSRSSVSSETQRALANDAGKLGAPRDTSASRNSLSSENRRAMSSGSGKRGVRDSSVSRNSSRSENDQHTSIPMRAVNTAVRMGNKWKGSISVEMNSISRTRRKMDRRQTMRERKTKEFRRMHQKSAPLKRRLNTAYDVIVGFCKDITLWTIVSCGIAVLFTWLADALDITADVQFSIVLTPVVFPLAFAINSAYQRRERLLAYLGVFKASLMELHNLHRLWQVEAGVPAEAVDNSRKAIRLLILYLRSYFTTYETKDRGEIIYYIYAMFSVLSGVTDSYRKAGKLPGCAPLVTRLIHYHHLATSSFEGMRNIREYHTPRSVRAFTKIFVFIVPVLGAPYYVQVGRNSQQEWIQYFMAAFVAFVLSSLQNVQDQLDDPFDGVGEDDIEIGQEFSVWLEAGLQTTTCSVEGARNELPDVETLKHGLVFEELIQDPDFKELWFGMTDIEPMHSVDISMEDLTGETDTTKEA